MKKRVVSIVLGLLFVLAVAGCGGCSPPAESEPTTSVSTESPSSLPEVSVPPVSEPPATTPPEVSEELSSTATEPPKEPSKPETPATTGEEAITPKTMYARQAANLRNLPTTTDSKIIGSLKVNDEVVVNAKTTDGWYAVASVNGNAVTQKTYVSGSLLQDTKVEVAKPPETTSPPPTDTTPAPTQPPTTPEPTNPPANTSITPDEVYKAIKSSAEGYGYTVSSLETTVLPSGSANFVTLTNSSYTIRIQHNYTTNMTDALFTYSVYDSSGAKVAGSSGFVYGVDSMLAILQDYA